MHPSGLGDCDWQRCMEGFSRLDDVTKGGMSLATGKHKRLRTAEANCKGFLESSFSNVIELASNESGQEGKDSDLISWTSSDDDCKVNAQSVERNKSRPQKPEILSHTKTKRSPKVSKLKLRRLSPDFEVVSSDGSIATICSSSDDDTANVQNNLTSTIDDSGLSPSTQCTEGKESSSIGSYQSSSASPSKSGLKVSDWMKAIDWQTPVKSGSQDGEEEGVELDSAKKKRIKHRKGGFAEQLSRLRARERSSLRIWEHQKTEVTDSSCKIVLARVEKFEVLYSLQVAQCHVTSIQIDTLEEGEKWNSPAEFEGGEWESKIILFSKYLMEKLQISPGSLVKIYPPWQQLHLSSLNKPILLCTNYTRVICPGEGLTAHQKDYAGNLANMDMVASWRCPCSQDFSINPCNCAATKFPYHPSSAQSKCLDGSQSATSVNHPGQLHPLHTEQQQSRMAVCDSLLESIQRASTGHLLPFRAVLQRVFCTAAKRYSCLVEDSHGTMAVVQLEGTDGDVQQAHGYECVFSGLRVITRSNKERNIRLLSLVEGAWSGHSGELSSQESQENPETTMNIPSPSFCYILAPSEDIEFAVDVSSVQSSLYRPPTYSNLSEISKTETTTRVSTIAKVIHRRKLEASSKSDFPSHVWYVADNSLHENYTTITLTTDCHVPGLSRVAAFTDVYFNNGELQADGYSRLWPQPPTHFPDLTTERYKELESLSVCLPPLGGAPIAWSLVTVQGVIASVDEDGAYSWEECDGCGSDRLTAGRQTQEGLVCAACQRVVVSPAVKLKMEVHLKCSIQAPVKIDLHQTTIERLLPAENSTESEEGYDIDSVLNKEIGTIYCIVLGCHDNNDEKGISLREITF